MIKKFRYCVIAGGLSLLFFLHVYGLAGVPGLHYDEAWAMNYSWRIVSEPGFWPLAAMSPYTAPWAHYWAAFSMWIFGPSLVVFRGSQMVLAFFGLIAIAFALPSERRAAFPVAVLLLPGLILNHRFAVELTGFHVLAFGLLCLGLRRRKYWLASAAALAGTTAHILFYGVALGLLAAVFLERIPIDKQARRAGALYFGLMALFFTRVISEIPEKGKALALLLSCAAGFGLLLCGGERWRIWHFSWWKRLLPWAAAVFVANCIFFAQGFWLAEIFTGFESGVNQWIVQVCGCLALAAVFLFSLRETPAFVRTWFFLVLFFLGVMMLKPAPRYYELAFLGLAGIFTLGISKHRLEGLMARLKTGGQKATWMKAAGIALLLACLAKNTGGAMAMPFLSWEFHFSKESSLHFLFFKDSSRDFLNKQRLVGFLGGSGCSLSDIHTNDPRLLESLKALALGDWPVASAPCAWNFVTRRSEANGIGEPFGDFMLRRKN